MEIKKFEAYNYKGKDLGSIDRSGVLTEIRDLLSAGKLFGYDINGTSYSPGSETLLIYLTKESKPGKTAEWQNQVLKIDFSDVGIEIGTQEWNDELEEMNEFIPTRNLDTEISKQMKSYKKDIKNYNI